MHLSIFDFHKREVVKLMVMEKWKNFNRRTKDRECDGLTGAMTSEKACKDNLNADIDYSDNKLL